MHELFGQHLGGEEWTVRRLKEGASGRPLYLGESHGRQAVLKLGASGLGLRRLAAIGVAPELLGEGVFRGESYVLLSYLAGKVASAVWLAEHLGDVATLMSRYHRDPQLADILRDAGAIGNESEVAPLEGSRLQVLQEYGLTDADFARFRDLAVHVPAVTPVPTHGDPNLRNFFSTKEQLLMIDWDGLCMADLGRDVGPFLWWYARPDRWSVFFDAYGEVMPDASVYWWAARVSLQVGMWLVERGKPDEAAQFLADFAAASRMNKNPRGHWSSPRDH